MESLVVMILAMEVREDPLRSGEGGRLDGGRRGAIFSGKRCDGDIKVDGCCGSELRGEKSVKGLCAP